MSRHLALAVVAAAILAMAQPQERPVLPPVLPPGPAPGPTPGAMGLVEALFVQANMIEGGQVMFLATLEDPDPDKVPEPAVFVKVDGKGVRAFGVDRQPLDVA